VPFHALVVLVLAEERLWELLAWLSGQWQGSSSCWACRLMGAWLLGLLLPVGGPVHAAGWERSRSQSCPGPGPSPGCMARAGDCSKDVQATRTLLSKITEENEWASTFVLSSLPLIESHNADRSKQSPLENAVYLTCQFWLLYNTVKQSSQYWRVVCEAPSEHTHRLST
jgi:hypothetical protein